MDTQEKENTQKENTQNKQIQKKETDNPHDKGYKRIFSIKKHFLHFIKKYIALEWMMELEEKDLELIDGLQSVYKGRRRIFVLSS